MEVFTSSVHVTKTREWRFRKHCLVEMLLRNIRLENKLCCHFFRLILSPLCNSILCAYMQAACMEDRCKILFFPFECLNGINIQRSASVRNTGSLNPSFPDAVFSVNVRCWYVTLSNWQVCQLDFSCWK